MRHSCMHDNISCMIVKVLFKVCVRHCWSQLINLFCSLFFPKAAVSLVENCVCVCVLFYSLSGKFCFDHSSLTKILLVCLLAYCLWIRKSLFPCAASILHQSVNA